ncbi:MAG: DUF885 family protein [Flavobacteriaceae bacterium]
MRFLMWTLWGLGLLGTVSLHAQTASERLQQVMDSVQGYQAYDRSQFPLGRASVAVAQKRAAFAQGQLQTLQAIPASELSVSDQISHRMLQFVLQDRIDRFTYKMHLIPIQADQGFHLNLNYRIRPLLSYHDAKAYLRMLEAIPQFVTDHLALMRQGIQEGYVQPAIIFKGYDTTYDRHIVSNYAESDFYEPFKTLPSQLDARQRDSILGVAERVITTVVVPSFQKIKTFFEEEYYPRARPSLGASELPNGKAFYQNRINYYTTTNQYTAQDIHEIGMAEVDRIKAEMRAIIQEVGFQGDFLEFLTFLRTDPQFYAATGEALLKEARDIAKRIDGELPKFFSLLPRTPYGVVKVPDALAPKYTGGRYAPPGSDTQPGRYLVNTYDLKSRPLYVLPALTAHEAVPGHHLQGSLNRELGDSIPQFRKNLYLSAYGEGWALYTEYLADEMGIYTTPYERFGKLTYEMWRACRLVGDTGLHAFGWSRDQAVNYLMDNTALSQHECNTETDRYIAWPGQALSYKMGELKIRELRNKAEEALGERFDIRAFHQVILGQGTVTLPILEEQVMAYIEQSRK